MKKILNSMLLLIVAAVPLLTSCEDDNDSNPTLSIPQSFVLNTPGLAAGNVYDLPNGTVNLTTNQPDYGGWPAAVTYAVQASLTGADGTWTELPTTYTSTRLSVNGDELNTALLDQYKAANDDNLPEGPISAYLRLRAFLADTGVDFGQVFSNPITIKAYAYEPPVQLALPTAVYVCGNSIGTAWTTWKPLAPVYGKEGKFYTMIYNGGDGFKWGNKPNDWFGYDKISEFDNHVDGLEISTDNDGNIVFSKAGWYVLKFTASIEGKKVKYILGVYDGHAYIIGSGAGGNWDDSNPEWEMQPNSDNIWVSPEFAGSGELRAYISVPGEDWWRTEFTLFGGELYFRVVDIPHNWAEDVGEEYSVSVSTGSKLYVDFNNNTGEVK
ncbi:MAG: SusF/SusE family outer membrane protein [Prevotella sp.]|nr:SusF/SusE family outer membrane protein [Prevotella sp.]